METGAFHRTITFLCRSKSIEPELQFEKVSDRIALFEGYTDKINNSPIDKDTKDKNNEKMQIISADQSILPPPRPPPPIEYVKDAFMTSNYFSLPRNSRIIYGSDEHLSAPLNNNSNPNIAKSASFSNFSKIRKEKGPGNNLPNSHTQNKSIHRTPPFDDYIITTRPTGDQQKITGRIIG